MIEEAREPVAAGRTLTCHPAAGATGIAEVLAQAVAGDTVVLSPGVYESTITLVVPSGVTMRGDGEAILRHGVDSPAIAVIGGHDVTLSGFTVVCTADRIRRRVLPDDPPLPEPVPEGDTRVSEWGLVWARDAVAVRFDRLRIEGRPEHEFLRGLVLLGTRDCRVSDCVVEKFGGSALSLISSTDAVVESCDLSFSSNGIALFRSRATLDAPSNAVIRSNRCHDNAGAGIVLFSSDSSDIAENECWENGNSGIVLARDPKSADAPSKAVIRTNRSHDNAGTGIILFSSESSDLSENECWENDDTGIVLRRHEESADAPSKAVIRTNRSHHNKQAGIGLFSSESSDLSENECWENGFHGIVLQRDEKCADAPSRAVIRANRCHQNKQTGIVLLSSESSDLSENECWENGFHGIVLQSDEKCADAPSRAVIRTNRSHHNKAAGIVLFSSESSDLSENECWENDGTGIVLRRDEESADAPSKAVIRTNRSHHNKAAGIVLFSSESSDLSENECWENGFRGIVLARDQKSTDAPSKAVIRTNRCHHNTESGIVLLSSESSDLSENDCWENDGTGIVLARDPKSADAPSKAVIRTNRCHHNGHGYAIDAGASVIQAGNRAWHNEHAPSLIAPDGTVLGPLDWFIAGAGETGAETLHRLRSRIVGGSAAARLAAEGHPAPDTAARAVVSGPSARALAALLADDAVDDDVGGNTTPDGPEHDCLHLSRRDDHRVDFRATGRADLVATVWSRVRRHVVDRRCGATVIGVAGDCSTSVDRLIRSVAAMRDADPERLPDGDLRPTGAASLIMQMRAQGERLSVVVRADVRDRSEVALAGMTPVRALLEPARPEGFHLWTARAAELATSLAFGRAALRAVIFFLAVAAFVGHLKGAEAPWWDLWTAALHAVTSNIKDAQLKDAWELPALVIPGLLGFFVLLNRHLPGHLAAEPPIWLARFAEKLHVDTPDRKAARRGAPWRRFVRRRVFANGGIGVVVLTDAAEWSDEDCRALQDLLTLRRDDETLIVVVTMATRTVLDRALLRPFADGAEVDLMLVLEPEHGALAPLAVSEAKTREALGLETDLDNRILDAIRDRRWTIGDLQPMLTLGSTSRAPFCVRRSALIDLQHFGPPLRDALEPFARLYLADAGFRLEIERDAVALESGLTMARRASSTRVFSRAGPIGEEYEISGRFEMRDTMAGIVARIYADTPEVGDDYVLRMMHCGMWFALNTAARVVDRGDVLTTRLLDARRHLESAARLAEDAETFSSARAHLRAEEDGLAALRRARREMLAAHRRSCLERLVSWRLPAPNSRERALASQLFALLVHLGAVEDVPEPIEQGDCPPDPTLGQCFAFHVGAALAAFAGLDRDLARQSALRALRAEGHFLRARDDGRLTAQIDERWKYGRPLADFLARATSLSEFTACIDAHAACGSDGIVTVLVLAVEEIETEDQAVRLARLIERLRGRGVQCRPTPRIRGFHARPSHSVEDLLGWLETPEAIERLLENAKRAPTETIDLLEIMYGSTDRIFGIEKPTSIVLGEAESLPQISIGLR